ncbi:MAG: TfoX/Sxy family protein [Armatimonadetes bacterium]|nr:TfoX/Sxy family protein [Armatimonadota bacterium]
MTIHEAAELLSDAPELTHRAMFGGYGLYTKGKMFAIMDEGVVYLKGDSVSIPIYEEAGGQQFSYLSKDGPMQMKYWSFRDDETLLAHLQDALDTAARAPAPKPKKPKVKKA